MEIVAVLQQFPVVVAYQFGSSVQGRGGPMSDLDLAVLVTPETPEQRYLRLQMEILLALDPVTGYAPVDLVVLNRASPLLQHEVIATGRVLYARSEADRRAFVEAVRRAYWDTAYLRRVQYAALRARLNAGALGDPSRVYFVAA
jgi:predicted nucleotidyltransferase